MMLQQIESFLSVADTASFSRAAKDAHASQSTMSRQVKMLERELGFPLFQRDKRPLRLTKAGELYYEGARSALGQLDYARQMAQAAALGRSGSLSVGFMSGVYAEYPCLPILDELRQACRDLRITCCKHDVDGLIRGLRDESIDVALSMDFDIYGQAGLNMTRVSPVTILLVVSSQHRLASKSRLGRDDMDGETLYLNTPMEAYRLDSWMGALFNLDRIRRVEVPSNEEAYLKVLHEGGVAISNAYDPMVASNRLYHCIALPLEERPPCICAIDDPANRNAAKALFLELVKHIQMFER